MSAFKAAVIGCGRMGAFTSASMRAYAPECWFPLAHAEALLQADGVELSALCEPQAANLAEAMAQYVVKQGFENHAELLAEFTPDLVGIATRTIGRADIIEDCLGAGAKALHCEKPICNSVSELERLVQRFEHDDVFVTLGAIRRHLAPYKQAIRWAQSGQFGNLLEAHGEFGPRALFWSHPHTVDLILAVAGGAKIEAVQARLGTVEREGTRIINDPIVHHAAIWFEGGFSGHISRLAGTDFRLACETAQLAVRNNGHSLWRCGPSKNEMASAAPNDPAGPNPYHDVREFAVEHAKGIPQGTLAPVMQLVACLRGDAEAIAANAALKRDIISGQRVLFAMVQSHLEGGRPVSLSEVHPDMRIEARTGELAA